MSPMPDRPDGGSRVSQLPADLIRAYLETDYHVFDERGFRLRVGERSPELCDLYTRHVVSCCAFLTASNPFSELLDELSNTRRRRLLEDHLGQLGVTHLSGMGRHPSNDWPGEDSVLVLGLSLEASKAIGRLFDQNAIVWCGSDAVPHLITLR
jgi:hypothetical protein